MNDGVQSNAVDMMLVYQDFAQLVRQHQQSSSVEKGQKVYAARHHTGSLCLVRQPRFSSLYVKFQTHLYTLVKQQLLQCSVVLVKHLESMIIT